MTGHSAALYRLVTAEAGDARTDGDLLARFAAGRDGAAFAELVRRHGPTVFGVCRRTVGGHHDAEDAFQATFLVLARKANRIDRPELLGNWLYGVAVRVSAKARRRLLRRVAREKTGVAMPDPPTRPVTTETDGSGVLDAEIEKLPSHYREAILLCDVQGVPRPEAAVRLGVPDGTLSSRLANGRKRLAERLKKRGLMLPAAGMFAVAVPDALTARTVDVALCGVAGAAVPYPILELTRTGGSVMRYAIGAAVLTTAGLVAGSVAAWPQEKKTEPPAKADTTAKVEGPKAASGGALRPKRLKTVDLAYDASRAFWSSDGRFLAVEGSNTFDVFDSQKGFLKLGHESRLDVVGFVPGAHVLVAVTPRSSRINAAHQLATFRLEPRPTPDGALAFGFVREKTIDLDEHPGFWCKLGPDGKQIISISAASVPSEMPDPDRNVLHRVAYTFHVTDLETGRPVREFPLPLGEYRTAELSPDGKTLIVVHIEPPKVVVSCFRTEDGGQAWRSETGHEGAPARSPQAFSIAMSRDGSQVIVAAGFQLDVAGNPGGGRGGRGSVQFGPTGIARATNTSAVLISLDMRSGKPLPFSASNRQYASISVGGYSTDGKLFAMAVGDKSARSEPSVLLVDPQSGKVVKSWSGYAVPSFAPNRSLLALLEPFVVSEQNDGQGSTIVRHTSLGFWDCSAPAK